MLSCLLLLFVMNLLLIFSLDHDVIWGDMTQNEVDNVSILFQNRQKISRKVYNLDNGVMTITSSKDPEVNQAIKNHVRQMMGFVSPSRNGRVLLHDRFATELHLGNSNNLNSIQAFITDDDEVRVIQTSESDCFSELIQQHASAVNDFILDGFAAVNKISQPNCYLPSASFLHEEEEENEEEDQDHNEF